MIARIEDIPQSWRDLLAAIRAVAPSAVLAGGALRDRDNGRPVKDLDIFVEGEGSDDLMDVREKLIERGFECSFPNSDEMYPIAQGEVVGFFDVSHPTLRPAGAAANVQLIVVRWSTEDIMSRFDFGICQIAFDGTAVERTAHYLQDQEERTFTIVRERRDEALEASVERFARLSPKYPGWNFQLGLALREELF
jgi:hypothetical protein